MMISRAKANQVIALSKAYQRKLMVTLARFAGCSMMGRIKGARSRNRKKPVISRIYIVAHTWLLCSVENLMDGMNPH